MVLQRRKRVQSFNMVPYQYHHRCSFTPCRSQHGSASTIKMATFLIFQRRNVTPCQQQHGAVLQRVDVNMVPCSGDYENIAGLDSAICEEGRLEEHNCAEAMLKHRTLLLVEELSLIWLESSV